MRATIGAIITVISGGQRPVLIKAPVLAFTLRHSIVILNVAGLRITGWAEGFGLTRDVMTQMLRNLGTSPKP